MRKAGFEFPVAGFRFQVSGVGSLVSDRGYSLSGFRAWVSGFVRLVGCFSVCLVLSGIGMAQQPKPVVLKGGKLLTISH